jgi:hypothetical protein
MEPHDPNSAIIRTVETLTVSHYQITANQAALMTMLSRALDLAGLKLRDGETTKQTYDRLRTAALEQSVLTLGDTQPTLAEELQRLIDEVRGE